MPGISVTELQKYLDQEKSYWKNFVLKIKNGEKFTKVDNGEITINIDKFTGKSENLKVNNDEVFENCLAFDAAGIEIHMRTHCNKREIDANVPAYVLYISDTETVKLSDLEKDNINPKKTKVGAGDTLEPETQELISLYYFKLAIENDKNSFTLFSTWYNILIPETEKVNGGKKVTVGEETYYMNEYLSYIVEKIATYNTEIPNSKNCELFVRTNNVRTNNEDEEYVFEEEGNQNIFKLSSNAKEWFQNFHKQEGVLLKKYRNPSILPIGDNKKFDSFERIDSVKKDRESNIADWVADFIRENFHVQLKHWDPADVWLTRNDYFTDFKKYWDERIKNIKTTTKLEELAEFNIDLQKALIEKKIWGVSLKKVTGSSAHMTLHNVDFGNLKKMLTKNETFLKNLDGVDDAKNNNVSDNYKLDSIDYSNGANNGQLNFVPIDGKELPMLNLQIRKNNSGNARGNLKFEAKYVGHEAQLGQTPLPMLAASLKKALPPGQPGDTVFKNDNEIYPSTKDEYVNDKTKPYIMPNAEGWKNATQAMENNIREKLKFYIKTDKFPVEPNSISNYLATANSKFGFTDKESNLARSNLMIICFLYNLSQIKDKNDLNNFCLNMVSMAQKVGTGYFAFANEKDIDEMKELKFGPFYKIY